MVELVITGCEITIRKLGNGHWLVVHPRTKVQFVEHSQTAAYSRQEWLAR